jgi:hypothetical protein
MIEPRESTHVDSALQAALVRALEENAVLRRSLEDRSLTPSARRWIGQAIAGVILVIGLAATTYYLTKSQSAREFRRGIAEGYYSGWADGRANRPPRPPNAPAPIAAPAPAALPAPAAAPMPAPAPAAAPARVPAPN